MAELAFWNTKTRRKEIFRPIDRGNVRMYVCGPTVYDRAHIGNARPVVVFDTLCRLLRHVFGDGNVTYARNLTDVDDKINGRAAELRADGDPRPILEIVRSVTDETIGWYHADMAALGASLPTHEPRATDYIQEMIEMIKILIGRGHAYCAEGHVLFDVSSYADYGKLARQSLKDMRAGARVEVAPYKKDNLDFVLWKPSSPEIPGWESPWGRGRPGWHIECSAMSRNLLGPTFDIHAGGIDLAFPHHENEVAQSVCAHPDDGFANLWMHNGFLQVNGQKMAKSLGNFFTVKDLIDRNIDGGVIRLVLLGTHYRQPLDWTGSKLKEAREVLKRWRRVAINASEPHMPPDPGFISALADDLNTPQALAELHRLAAKKDAESLLSSASILGLLQDIPLEGKAEEIDLNTRKLIEELLHERTRQRELRNFARADEIRDAIRSVGVEVNDRPGGTGWDVVSQVDTRRLCDIADEFREQSA